MTRCTAGTGSALNMWTCASLLPDLPSLVDSIPAALTLCGWALLPPTWTSWMQLLAALPVDLPPLATPLHSGEWNDVFTDGSCLASSCPLVRCAAWSVTLAAPFHASWTPGQAKVLCASFLPGLVQTAYRADLYAVTYALHWAAWLGASVRIWTDGTTPCTAPCTEHCTAPCTAP